jgi:hypothetical protein
MISALAVMLVLVACGGGTAPTPAGTLAPGQTPSPVQPTPAGPAEPGESITGENVLAAVTALQALDSWTFEATYWTRGLGANLESSVDGTERRTPEVAIAATHSSTAGDFQFIHIGDDIWTTLGTDEFFHYDAEGSENLLEQYEPSYIATLVGAVSRSTLEFEPVAVETVNGIATTHFTLSENDRENVTQTLDIDPALWAGDAWIANDGGYLVALAWGPQSLEDAQPIQGFRYDVTSVNCTCPVEPPD